MTKTFIVTITSAEDPREELAGALEDARDSGLISVFDIEERNEFPDV